MSDERALTVIQQQDVPFYEESITVVRVEGGTIFVPIRPICERIGIDWSSQSKRIHRDPVLSAEARRVVVMTTHRGGQETLCLPLEFMHGWLFGLNASRAHPDLREALIRYQRDCYRVLAEAFAQNRVTAAPTVEGVAIEELLQSADDPEAQAYRMALAIANIARQQLVLRYQTSQHSATLSDHEQRLGLIEARLQDSARFIDAGQASRISQAVKTIALEIGRRSGRNEFGGVYGELYRRFGITGYKELPAGRFDEAITFLRHWYQTLTDNADLPF
jgi:hypothetical protein